MNSVYARNPDFVQRDVAGECVLIPIRHQLTDVKSIFVLNETGAVFWHCLDGKRSVRALMNDLLVEYDVTCERLEQDLSALIQDLLSIEAILEAGP